MGGAIEQATLYNAPHGESRTAALAEPAVYEGRVVPGLALDPDAWELLKAQPLAVRQLFSTESIEGMLRPALRR